MRRALALAAFAISACASQAAVAQLFDDNEARRRIDVLRQQVEATQRAADERLAKVEAASADRGAILELSSQLSSMREELARMRGQIEVLTNQVEGADKRQKDLYLDIDTRL